jgi:hypothetical protein
MAVARQLHLTLERGTELAQAFSALRRVVLVAGRTQTVSENSLTDCWQRVRLC